MLTMELKAKMETYSSGLVAVELKGSPVGCVAALRAIMQHEGMPAAKQARESVRLSDSGTRTASVYACVAPNHLGSATEGRSVSYEESSRVGRDLLSELGFVVAEMAPWGPDGQRIALLRDCITALREVREETGEELPFIDSILERHDLGLLLGDSATGAGRE